MGPIGWDATHTPSRQTSFCAQSSSVVQPGMVGTQLPSSQR